MRKLFRKIHLWLSVPFGLIITLICFSGAMLVFEDEVYELTHSERYFVKNVGSSAIPIDELLEKVATILPDSVSITGVSVSSDPERTYQVNLSKPRRTSIYVDPYTGDITGKSERSGFFMCMFRLHRWLLDSMEPAGGVFVGKMVVGVSTLLFVMVLISGLVVWWPRTRKALKNSLKISPKKGWRRLWYDLHVAGGIYAFVFLLVMALTGLTWSFPWYRTAFYKVFGVEVQQLAHGKEQKSGSQKSGSPRTDFQKVDLQRGNSQRNESQENQVREGEAHAEKYHEGKNHAERSHAERSHAERSHAEKSHKGRLYDSERTSANEQSESEKIAPSAFAYWQEVYDKLSRQNPEYKQISVSSGTASVSFHKFGNQRAADRYTFNIENGEFTETSLYQHQDESGKIRGWIYSVHVGSWGGITTRILAFLAALIGTMLPLTGYYLWIRKIVNKRKRNTSEDLASAHRL